MGELAVPTPKEVLIVDDDPELIASFRRSLAELPVRLSFARNAEEAIAQVDRAPPMLLITDYQLPDLDGVTLIERVKASHPEVLCVLHTGEPVLRFGFGSDIPVLWKPCPPETLRELILACLSPESA